VKEGTYVNLGVGIPTMVSNYLKERDVILHAENGVLGYGEMVTEEHEEIDPDIYNAAGQFVVAQAGCVLLRQRDVVRDGARRMDRHRHPRRIRSGSDRERVANWSTSDAKSGGIGGAMDLLSGQGDLIIVMEHTDSKGRPKLRRRCSYPLTGRGCVTYIVTDLALLHWNGTRFVLEEIAPGFTPDEVMGLTEMQLVAAPDVKTMA
jgi:3-oxoacid CoA-transferase